VGIMACMNGARDRKALSDCLDIVHAVERYNGEYGQMPKIDPNAAVPKGAISDDRCGDPAAGMHIDNAALFNILRDIDQAPNAGHSQNLRRQVYMEGRTVSNNNKPRDGFVDAA